MKRITTLILISIIPMTMIHSQPLSERQKGLAACACLMAQGDTERLEPPIRKALDEGVSINELKEAFSQLYTYTGFPRSLNALGILSKVLTENPSSTWQEGKPWTRPAGWDDARKAFELGVKNQTKLAGNPVDLPFSPQSNFYLKSHLFGDIFANDQLTAADGELVTVAALKGLDGVAPQLDAHLAGAVNMGNSKEQVDELCAWLDCEGYTLRSGWGKGNANTGYAQYFTGNSYLNPVNPANLPEAKANGQPSQRWMLPLSLAAATTGTYTTAADRYLSALRGGAGIKNGAKHPLPSPRV